jgi:hypothetical protein
VALREVLEHMPRDEIMQVRSGRYPCHYLSFPDKLHTVRFSFSHWCLAWFSMAARTVDAGGAFIDGPRGCQDREQGNVTPYRGSERLTSGRSLQT